MADPEDLSAMGGNARRNLRRFGVDVRPPRGYDARYFASPELTRALQAEPETDVIALIREEDAVDDLDVSFGTYDYRTDRIGVNHGTIKAILLGLVVEKYADDVDVDPDERVPPEFYETTTPSELDGVLSADALAEWEAVRERSMAPGLDPNADLNVLAVLFDLLRSDRADFDLPWSADELGSLYREQVVRLLEHELLHKHQAAYGVPAHVGEIVCTIWSVERAPIYRLLEEVTDEDLQVGAMVVEAMQGYERLGYHGIAADSMEIVTAYEGYRASQRERLRWLLSLQYEFVPEATGGGGLLRPIVKGIVVAAAFQALFG